MLEMPPNLQRVVESYLTLSSRCGSNTGRHKGTGDASVTRESSQATPNPSDRHPQPHVEIAQGLQATGRGRLLRTSEVGGDRLGWDPWLWAAVVAPRQN